MSTNIANCLHLPLGHAQEGPVSLDLSASPHTLVLGGTGTGKTLMLRSMAETTLTRGFRTVIIDAIRRGAGFRAFTGRADFATSRKEATEALDGIVTEMTRRYDLLHAHGESTVWDLPASEDLEPIFVIVDEYAATVADADTQEHIDQVEAIKRHIAAIVRLGRAAGIHLVISTQRADAQDLPMATREHLDNVIVTVRPGMHLSPVMVAMVAGGVAADKAAVSAALGKAAAEEARGYAVMVTSAGATVFRQSLPAEP
ncbi:DUF87 domain-containing protein [Pseudarthrobacter phenanthrenivorans]|uniref:helicase HerA domain-containing protein n=1 Tax=Pseudarthrobacter phenanthrenivorans TaxID=361575 RepID=UPI00344D0D93